MIIYHTPYTTCESIDHYLLLPGAGGFHPPGVVVAVESIGPLAIRLTDLIKWRRVEDPAVRHDDSRPHKIDAGV